MLLGAVSPSNLRSMVTLESQRSLGAGQLAAFLDSSDEATAARAALAIGRTKLPAGIPLLEAHLDDRRASVRALSVYGLGLIGTGSDVARIADDAHADPSGAVRVASLDALGRYEDAKVLDAAAERDAAAAVMAALASDRDPIVRGRAAITLSFFGDSPEKTRALDALVAATRRDAAVGVRERAMWSIFRRYATLAPRPFLREMLLDPDIVVRIEAVRAYGKLGTAAAADDLLPLLHDSSWRVQEQTAESINVLRGGKMTEHLTAVPSYAHVPPPQPDPLAVLAPRPWPSVAPGAPTAAQLGTVPALVPTTAEQMVSPARGPHPRVRFVTTQGDFYVVLFPEWAPMTVANFMNLAARGFYDNNRWFRIVPDFVVQTGEQDDVKAPGPGYTIVAEENPLEQNAYVISMGLDYDDKTQTPKRDSAGSEYYITLSPQYHLDNAFTVFGEVTSGFDVFARLAERDKVLRVERVDDANL
ncbi:MAG: peptidylprolyl isomerase [bacterium]|nr:peptidylprolyl isomerase [bacterium]